MARKLVVAVSNDNEGVTPLESIAAIKAAGFSEVFVQWYNKDWEISQQEQLEYIRKLDLKVSLAHLGYSQINHIWLDDEIGESLVASYKKDFDICKSLGISRVIMHLTKTVTAPAPSALGLARFKELAAYAEDIALSIAIENTRHKEHFDYVLAGLTNKNVGVCFDIGHCHMCFPGGFEFERYRNRILEIHLHDNNKQLDQHLLPYDGTIDWQSNLAGLKQADYQGNITLELCYKETYLKMSLVDFYRKAYDIGQQLLAYFTD